jgi:hypothetical protein
LSKYVVAETFYTTVPEAKLTADKIIDLNWVRAFTATTVLHCAWYLSAILVGTGANTKKLKY